MFFDPEKRRKKTSLPARIAGIRPYDCNRLTIYLSFIDNKWSLCGL